MPSLPARELLDAVHNFPCQYVFKAVGLADDEFVSRVVVTIRETLELEFDPPFETRETPAGRHVSVTVTLSVQSSDEVLLIYERMSGITGLVMLL